MTDIAATSSIAKAAEGMKALLAGSATFQTLVSAAAWRPDLTDITDLAPPFGLSPAASIAASAFIHIAAYVPDAADSFVRPFAVISDPGAGRSRKTGRGRWNDSGEFVILIEREIPAAYRDDDQQSNAELEFKNAIGAVIEEVRILSEQPGYLMLRNLDITDGPFRYAAASGIGDVMGCKLQAAWGLSD